MNTQLHWTLAVLDFSKYRYIKTQIKSENVISWSYCKWLTIDCSNQLLTFQHLGTHNPKHSPAVQMIVQKIDYQHKTAISQLTAKHVLSLRLSQISDDVQGHWWTTPSTHASTRQSRTLLDKINHTLWHFYLHLTGLLAVMQRIIIRKRVYLFTILPILTYHLYEKHT